MGLVDNAHKAKETIKVEVTQKWMYSVLVLCPKLLPSFTGT